MKNILVLVEDHSCIESVMASALTLGKTFGSTVEGIPIAPDISDIVVADISIGATIFDARTRQVLVERSRHHFDEAVQRTAYPTVATPDGGSLAVWTNQMTSDGGVGAAARVYDVVVVGRPGQGGHDPRQSTFEAVLFESGRPVLIAPPKVPQIIGETILIAWNRSSETARTVALAMPLLERAKRVVILTIEVPSVPGPSGALLAKTLRLHGVDASLAKTELHSANEGPAILKTAAEIGADLVIKGGYTQSRLRQMIFGGATSHILARSDLPVFMSH